MVDGSFEQTGLAFFFLSFLSVYAKIYHAKYKHQKCNAHLAAPLRKSVRLVCGQADFIWELDEDPTNACPGRDHVGQARFGLF